MTPQTVLVCSGQYEDGPCGAQYRLDKFEFPLMVGWSIDGTLCPSCYEFARRHPEEMK